MRNKALMLLVAITSCACFMWLNNAPHSAAKSPNPSPVIVPEIDSVESAPTFVGDLLLQDTNVLEEFMRTSWQHLKLTDTQRRNPDGQVGTKCIAVPRCPDCNGQGNVCRSAEQFYPGATYFLGAKKDMIRRCQQANALDYCGGSRNCVRLRREEQERHRANNGGGCYRQCERVVACAFVSR
jgi:hypothetical protein